MAYKRGNWTDDPCYYVDALDGKRIALVAGPFRTKEEAAAILDRARTVAYAVDPMSWFYNWGSCRWKNGYREGALNDRLGL